VRVGSPSPPRVGAERTRAHATASVTGRVTSTDPAGDGRRDSLALIAAGGQ